MTEAEARVEQCKHEVNDGSHLALVPGRASVMDLSLLLVLSVLFCIILCIFLDCRSGTLGELSSAS